jgi:hypothetical protein
MNKKKDQKENVIYIKETDVPLTSSRKQLVRYFLRGKAYTSYNNEACTSVQCKATANRSLTDLHAIVKSRFPQTSFEAILRIVKEFMEEDKSIILVWCTQIHKVVIRCVNNPTSELISNHSKTNYYNSIGEDGYSLRNIEEQINELK